MAIGISGFVKPSGYMILNSDFTVSEPITQAVMTIDLSELLVNVELSKLIDFQEKDIKLYINDEQRSVALEGHKISVEGWTGLEGELLDQGTYKIKMSIPTKIKKSTYSTKQYETLVEGGRQFPIKLAITSDDPEDLQTSLDKTYTIQPYKMPKIN